MNVSSMSTKSPSISVERRQRGNGLCAVCVLNQQQVATSLFGGCGVAHLARANAGGRQLSQRGAYGHITLMCLRAKNMDRLSSHRHTFKPKSAGSTGNKLKGTSSMCKFCLRTSSCVCMYVYDEILATIFEL